MARIKGLDGSSSDSKPQTFSAEETAVLDSAGSGVMKKVVTAVWRVKLRLQFTGWLQYTPTGLATLAALLAATIFHFFGVALAANAFALAGGLLLVVFVFDLVTVKFRIRFPEQRPKRNDDLGLFDLMRERRSCRSFQTRKLTADDHAEFMRCVRLHSASPTIGTFPVRFEYISAPLTVWPTVNATEFLVAIAPSAYNRLAVIDVGRSLQKIVIDATRMGLATCWIGPGADQTSIARDLGDRFDPQQDHIICVCAVGYKSWYLPLFLRIFNLQFRRRLPLSSLFFADPYFKKPLDVDAAPYSRFGRSYEICQWAPSSYNGQTTRCVAVTEQTGAEPGHKERNQPSLARFDFYAVTDSRYYAAVAVGIWCANWELGCEALGIDGYLAVLTPEQRGVQRDTSLPPLPRYDVSWIADGGT